MRVKRKRRHVDLSPVLKNSADILRGCGEIAKYIGENTDHVYYLIRSKQRPLARLIKRYRGELYASKSKIDAALRKHLKGF